MSTTEHAVRECQQLIGGTFAMEEFTEVRWITVQSGTHPFPF
jgi:hypothetical protein